MNLTLGLVQPTPGTPKAITANFPGLAEKRANTLYFQVSPANTGDSYVLLRNGSKVTKAGLIAILRPPTANHLPDIAWNIPSSPNPFVLEDYKVDVDQNGDGVQISALVW